MLSILLKISGQSWIRTVAIFSLEMGAESLVDRMLAAEGLIESHSIRTGQLTDEEWRKYAIAQGNLANASIYIDDTQEFGSLRFVREQEN